MLSGGGRKELVKVDGNWCAFCLAILKPIEVDEALFEIGIRCPKQTKASSTRKMPEEEKDRLALEILSLRSECYSWKEIGKMYGYTESGISMQMRAYKKKQDKKKVTQAPTKVS